MKSKKLLNIAVLSALFCVGATLQTASSKSANATKRAEKPLAPATPAQLQVFIDLYRKGDQAALQRDMRYFDETLAPNFTMRSLSGKILGHTQFIKETAAMYRLITAIESSTSNIENIGFRGKQAFLIVTGSGAFTVRGPDNKIYRLSSTSRSTETWILTSRGWLIQSTVITADRHFINGREVPVR